MMKINKFASVLALAAAVALPAGAALAATTTPSKPAAMTKMAPVTDPSGMVARWSAADISGIDAAKAVKIIDLHKAYGVQDAKKIAAYESANKGQIAKLRTALNNDAKFKAWAKKNHVNVEHVVGVSNGEVAVF